MSESDAEPAIDSYYFGPWDYRTEERYDKVVGSLFDTQKALERLHSQFKDVESKRIVPLKTSVVEGVKVPLEEGGYLPNGSTAPLQTDEIDALKHNLTQFMDAVREAESKMNELGIDPNKTAPKSWATRVMEGITGTTLSP